MTFLRRYEQFVHAPKWHRDEPPRDFAERAYAAGLEPGSGTVAVTHEDGFWLAAILCTFRGVRVNVQAMGASADDAQERLLVRLEGLGRAHDTA